MARGIAVDLLQMAKRVGPQGEAAEHEDLSGEEDFSLDSIVVAILITIRYTNRPGLRMMIVFDII